MLHAGSVSAAVSKLFFLEVIYADDERANNSGIPNQPENLL